MINNNERKMKILITILILTTLSKCHGMSPEEIDNTYQALLKAYPPNSLMKACIQKNQQQALKLLKRGEFDINAREPRFGKLFKLIEFVKSPQITSSSILPVEQIGTYDQPIQRISGFTALHYSIVNKMSILFSILLRHPLLDPNIADLATGNTPLHYAVKTIDFQYVYELTNQERCDPYKTNKEGLTPLTMAYTIKDELYNKMQLAAMLEIISFLEKSMDRADKIEMLPLAPQKAGTNGMSQLQNEA